MISNLKTSSELTTERTFSIEATTICTAASEPPTVEVLVAIKEEPIAGVPGKPTEAQSGDPVPTLVITYLVPDFRDIELLTSLVFPSEMLAINVADPFALVVRSVTVKVP